MRDSRETLRTIVDEYVEREEDEIIRHGDILTNVWIIVHTSRYRVRERTVTRITICTMLARDEMHHVHVWVENQPG